MLRFAPLFLVVALAVGTAVDAYVLFDAVPAEHVTTAEVRNLTLIRSYYAAVGDAIRTGDVTSVEAFLAPDFLQHPAASAASERRAGRENELSAIHESFEDVTLAVRDLAAEGDRVVARVAYSARARPAFVGIPLQRTTIAWEALDTFRIVEGKLAELWTSGNEIDTLRPILDAPLDAYPIFPSIVALARLTFRPGATLPRTAIPGPSVFVVESGALVVRGEELARNAQRGARTPHRVAAAPGTVTTVGSGEAIAVMGPTVTIGNAGDRDAVALVASIFPAAKDQWQRHNNAPLNNDPISDELFALAICPQDGAGEGRAPDGIEVEPVTSGLMTGRPLGSMSISLGRATLVQGGSIPPHAVTGFEAIVVEAGMLTIDVEPASATVRRDTGDVEWPSSRQPTHLQAGDGLFLNAGATSAPRNQSGAALVVLVLRLDSTEVMAAND